MGLPFGEDANDLPLEHFQYNMNNALLMLIHDQTDHVPYCQDDSKMDFYAIKDNIDKHPPKHYLDERTRRSIVSQGRSLEEKLSELHRTDSRLDADKDDGARP